MRRHHRGFTLVELAVVVVIIGVLAALNSTINAKPDINPMQT